MKNQENNTLLIFLAAALLFSGSPAKAESPSGYAEAGVSIALTIAHPVRMQVQADVICLYNYAERTFSIRQTQGSRAFDQRNSTPSRYHAVKDDRCKSGQTLQLNAGPAGAEQHALLHLLVEPD